MRRSESDGGSSAGSTSAADAEWEVRPGGMLVQRRDESLDTPAAPPVRLRVSHGAARYDVSVAARATVGELKKILAAETGMQPEEQRVLYRGKVRENGEYLDVCGVKNRSKLVMMVDPMSLERRYVEMRRNVKIQSVCNAISGASLEIDTLADQNLELHGMYHAQHRILSLITSIEKSISNGNKVADVQITTLIDLLMRQAVKLERIQTDGVTSPQKTIQAKRVQKCVEALDTLKISNSKVKPIIITTNWETFEAPNTARWEIFD